MEGIKVMTYKPNPIDVSAAELPDFLKPLLEELSRHVHDTWAMNRIEEGWKFGPERDDRLKEHPNLIPYQDLLESEKNYDRKVVAAILKALIGLGYNLSKP